ncbi:MAG: tRNA lysidine(34) synthetase TilS [Candidatus Hydrogenedentota bacterium]
MGYPGIITEFISIVRKYRLFDDNDKILVSLSAGPDSVALLYLLKFIEKRYNIKLFVVHINYQLRGENSNLDEKFCIDLCKDMGVDLFVEKVNVNRARIQTQAREIRFQVYNKIKEQTGIYKVVLAHHFDDCVETVIFKMFRGSGITGLKGIQFVTKRKDGLLLIRPMLTISKSRLLEFLNKNNLKYREDETNFDSIYTRNKIRNELIPLLNKIFGRRRVEQSIKDITELAEGFTGLIDELLKDTKIEEYLNKEEIPLISLNHNKVIITSFIKKYLEQREISVSKKKLGLLWEIINNQKGEIRVGVNYLFVIEDNCLKFKKIEKIDEITESTILLDLVNPVSLKDGSIIKIEKVEGRFVDFTDVDKNVAYIDRNKINGNLYIRYKRQGDKFCPLGLEGKTKKIKKFFIDEKIPIRKRRKIPLVVDGEKIIWVCGLRLDERVKIDNNTTEILKLEWQRYENGREF